MSTAYDYQAMIVADTEQVSSTLPDGDVVILSLKNGVYFGLNSVGARVWNLIQQPSSVEKIIEILLNEYDVDPELCKAQVDSLIHDLEENGLVQVEMVGQLAY